MNQVHPMEHQMIRTHTKVGIISLSRIFIIVTMVIIEVLLILEQKVVENGRSLNLQVHALKNRTLWRESEDWHCVWRLVPSQS